MDQTTCWGLLMTEYDYEWFAVEEELVGIRCNGYEFVISSLKMDEEEEGAEDDDSSPATVNYYMINEKELDAVKGHA